MKHDLNQLRKECPLPVLMNRLGLAQYAKNSCASPFRPDQHASWGIFQLNGRWLFKDFATGECGDEIQFLAQLRNLDPKRDFLKLLDLFNELAKNTAKANEMDLTAQSSPTKLPDQRFFTIGTDQQLKQLSELRKITIEGLQFAQARGVLKFGRWFEQEVYAVTDRSGSLGEIRRLDGQPFPRSDKFPSHKSHTLKHSRKHWPLGILEALDCAGIGLVEGMPDFLAFHQFAVEEGLNGKVAPVAMLTSSCDIATDALSQFNGKSIRIFPHVDEPGIDAAERWQRQLIKAGAKQVDFFNFRSCEVGAGSELKDLCDFNRYRRMIGYNQNILNSLAL